MLYDCTNLSVHVDDLHESELSEFYSIIILALISVLFHSKSNLFFGLIYKLVVILFLPYHLLVIFGSVSPSFSQYFVNFIEYSPYNNHEGVYQ